MTKGQKNPYDTAVAVEIHQYRKETKKLKAGTDIVDSLRAQIDELHDERKKSDSLSAVLASSNSILVKSNERKDSVITISTTVVKSVAQEAKKKPLIQRTGVIIAAVLIVDIVYNWIKNDD